MAATISNPNLMDVLYGKGRFCEKCKKEIVEDAPYCTDDNCLLQNIISWSLDPRGGYLTVVENNKYPLRALPLADQLNTVALLKRGIIAGIRAVFRLPFTPKRALYTALRWLADLEHSDYRGHLTITYDKLSPSSREFKRVLRKINPFPDTDQEDGANGSWVALIAGIYESDLAYRFRIQDILSQLNKQAFRENPRKEILRLIRLDLSRELAPTMQDKVRLGEKVFKIVWLIPTFRKFINAFFGEIDPTMFVLDTYDRYWCTRRFDYLYEGKSYEERMAWRAQEEVGWTPPVLQYTPNLDGSKPKIVVNQPNEAFYALPPEKAEEMAEQLKQTILTNHKSRNEENKKMFNP